MTWPTALEGQVVKLADALAYLNHDTIDAIRAGLPREEDLPDEVRRVLGHSHYDRLQKLIGDAVAASWSGAGERAPAVTHPEICLSDPVRQAADTWRDFLFARVYRPEDALPHVQDARQTVRFLLDYYRTHSDEAPEEFGAVDERAEDRAIDYVAGMTDHFASRAAAALGFAPAARRLSAWPRR